MHFYDFKRDFCGIFLNSASISVQLKLIEASEWLNSLWKLKEACITDTA